MKKLALLCGAMLLFAGLASAQDSPKVEAFGGYSYLRVNPGFEAPGENFNGGSGSVAYNFTPMLGVVADFGGYHWSQQGVDATAVTYLFGPKVALRHGPITPFAQALFGGAHLSGSDNNECDTVRIRPQGTIQECGSGSENAFSMAIGGGMDYEIKQGLSWRIIQGDYLLTRFFGDTQNNGRLSTGVVFRF